MATFPLFTTGNEPPANEYICRRFYIPKEFSFITAFDGALALLTRAENWQQGGTLSPEDAAKLASDMLLDGFHTRTCMLGAILPVATAELPENMLLCDGSTYLREDYPDLYAALNLGLIVDADHFTVPDLRDKFLLGAGSHSELSSGGEENATLIVGNMPSHTHNMYLHSHSIEPHSHTTQSHQHSLTEFTTAIQIPTGPGSGVWTKGLPIETKQSGHAVVAVNETALQTSNEQTFTYPTGGGLPHNNMPPFYALAYGIVAR